MLLYQGIRRPQINSQWAPYLFQKRTHSITYRFPFHLVSFDARIRSMLNRLQKLDVQDTKTKKGRDSNFSNVFMQFMALYCAFYPQEINVENNFEGLHKF